MIQDHQCSTNINGVIGTWLGARDLTVKKTNLFFRERERLLKQNFLCVYIHIFTYAHTHAHGGISLNLRLSPCLCTYNPVSLLGNNYYNFSNYL